MLTLGIPRIVSDDTEIETKVIDSPDQINPNHYKVGRTECIDIIEDLELNYNLGCAMKYLYRAGRKGGKKEDLKKAIWYMQRELASE